MIKSLFLLATILSSAVLLTSCDHKEKGSAQKAGKQIDEAANNIGHAIHNNRSMEQTGQKIDNLTK